MVISRICTQGLSLHWKTLDLLSGSVLCYSFVRLFVSLVTLSFVS